MTNEIRSPRTGRPSPATAMVTRGVCRNLRARGFTPLTEFPLRNRRRADIIALDAGGVVLIVEVKSSRADLLADSKWPAYRAFCDRFYFGVPERFPLAILPEDCGILVADAYHAEELRPAPHHALHASRRRALVLSFARTAAERLHRQGDPGITPSLVAD